MTEPRRANAIGLRLGACCLGIFLAASLQAQEAGTGDAMEQDAEVSICFNYRCLSQEKVRIEAWRLDAILRTLGEAENAGEERRRLAAAIGALYAIAAEQTPVGNDRGGNYADAGVFGRMDCIDHSTTTTRFLRLLAERGGLRWHRVLEPARRTRFWVAQHFSAVIEENGAPEDGALAASS
ncbi:MAG: hypothetical protein LBB55_03630, partial [Zoogloeaceae bacterium]|nr:hypothetical protein [Zoogloeaceae bacterium]